MPPTRKDLARRAMLRADEVRDRFDIAPQAAVNVFDLCGELFNPNILVRFQEISMEGLYLRQAKPEIWLGLRPLVRRVFNSAHELGHHVFGHGSTLDELKTEGEEDRTFEPDEFLVNTFAGYLLMPRLAMVNAFRLRGWKAEDVVPDQFFVVSCSLGVGYETLANHAAYSLELIGEAALQKLRRIGLPAIRHEMLGEHAPERLQVIDTHHTLPTVDTETGTVILLPAGTTAENENLIFAAETQRGVLFQAVKPGITRVFTPEGGWAVLIRIMRYQYHGLGRYRHFPREDGDDE
jgi:hypothetical protein